MTRGYLFNPRPRRLPRRFWGYRKKDVDQWILHAKEHDEIAWRAWWDEVSRLSAEIARETERSRLLHMQMEHVRLDTERLRMQLRAGEMTARLAEEGAKVEIEKLHQEYDARFSVIGRVMTNIDRELAALDDKIWSIIEAVQKALAVSEDASRPKPAALPEESLAQFAEIASVLLDAEVAEEPLVATRIDGRMVRLALPAQDVAARTRGGTLVGLVQALIIEDIPPRILGYDVTSPSGEFLGTVPMGDVLVVRRKELRVRDGVRFFSYQELPRETGLPLVVERPQPRSSDLFASDVRERDEEESQAPMPNVASHQTEDPLADWPREEADLAEAPWMSAAVEEAGKEADNGPTLAAPEALQEFGMVWNDDLEGGEDREDGTPLTAGGEGFSVSEEVPEASPAPAGTMLEAFAGPLPFEPTRTDEDAENSAPPVDEWASPPLFEDDGSKTPAGEVPLPGQDPKTGDEDALKAPSLGLGAWDMPGVPLFDSGEKIPDFADNVTDLEEWDGADVPFAPGLVSRAVPDLEAPSWTESSVTRPDPVEESPEPGPRETVGVDVMAFLQGKVVGRDIYDSQQNLVAAQGATIDAELVQRVEAAGQLPDLIVHMTLPGSSAS